MATTTACAASRGRSCGCRSSWSIGLRWRIFVLNRVTSAVSASEYTGAVAWTLRVRAWPGRHVDSQRLRYQYLNRESALNSRKL